MRFPARCKRCRFYWCSNGYYANMCEYIVQRGEPRGCPIDANCDKFEPRKIYKPKAMKIVR